MGYYSNIDGSITIIRNIDVAYQQYSKEFLAEAKKHNITLPQSEFIFPDITSIKNYMAEQSQKESRALDIEHWISQYDVDAQTVNILFEGDGKAYYFNRALEVFLEKIWEDESIISVSGLIMRKGEDNEDIERYKINDKTILAEKAVISFPSDNN